MKSEIINVGNPSSAVEGMIGRTYNQLTVMEFSGWEWAHSAIRLRKWFVSCRCSCGTVKILDASDVRHSKTKSCGCSHNVPSKHGHTRAGWSSPTSKSWNMMIQRCFNPKNKRYPHYGGRGITVCGEWMDFRNFLAAMGCRPDGLTLHRIHNDKNYEKGNCKWADALEQANSTSRNTIVTLNGELVTLAQAERKLGFRVGLLAQRMYSGWSLEKSLVTPYKSRAL